MADPANVLAVDDIAMMTGYEVRVAVASAEDIHALIGRLTARRRRPGGRRGGARTAARRRSSTCARPPTTRRSSSSSTRSSPRPSSAAPPTSTSSPSRREMRVRFRIDGVLAERDDRPARGWSPASSRRMKIMADLDIAERRLPQDGRVGLTVDGRHVDLRVVTLPSVHGESIVMRILDKERGHARPRQARHAPTELERFRARLQPGLRRRARHRPDRLGQVDDALRARSASSTRPRRTSSRSRTRSSTSSRGSPRSRSTRAPA